MRGKDRYTYNTRPAGRYQSRNDARLIPSRLATRSVYAEKSACELFQRTKWFSRRTEGAWHIEIAEGPNQIISMEFLGPPPVATDGSKYVFVALDKFSKLVTFRYNRHTGSDGNQGSGKMAAQDDDPAKDDHHGPRKAIHQHPMERAM